MQRQAISLLVLVLCLNEVYARPARIRDFLRVPEETNAAQHVHALTAVPHVAGSDTNTRMLAKWMMKEFTRHGLNGQVQPFRAQISLPVERGVHLLRPTSFNASMHEPPIEGDPTSSRNDVLPTYLAFGADGDVTAELVYANYGREEDFAYLDKHGISCRGRIVIMRFGQGFRGAKVLLAEKRGAAGVLIYSDPADDGFRKGPVYPDGPWRPKHGVQRGSVHYSMICPGDIRRVRECLGDRGANYTGTLIPSIPALPLSWGDAVPLLAGLEGKRAPRDWQGGVPGLSYHIGPGPAYVRMWSKNDWPVVKLQNVFGIIPGAVRPEEMVIIGSHRDAWVFGASDPASGTSAIIQTVRGFGRLLNDGWRPKRTIMFASWDGEEFGMLGSTYYGESAAEMLKRRAVLYINVDALAKGKSFWAKGSPSLEPLMQEAAQRVNDPATGRPLARSYNITMTPAGSGSDFVVFSHHLGIPALSFGFDGNYGVYHSIYDSFTWMAKFGDPEFKNQVAAAKLIGVLAILAADSTVLPISHSRTADALEEHYRELTSHLKAEGRDLNMKPLQESISAFRRAADYNRDRMQRASVAEAPYLNGIIMQTERRFLTAGGLPGRPWYKHVIYAPDVRSGYAPHAFPGIVAALGDRDLKVADLQIQAASRAILGAAHTLSDGTLPEAHSKVITPTVPLVLGVVGVLSAAVLAWYRFNRYPRRSYQVIESAD